jgi:hypothetical protein
VVLGRQVTRRFDGYALRVGLAPGDLGVIARDPARCQQLLRFLLTSR